MTRNQIIEQLYNSDDFNKVIKAMQPEHLQDDLKQEVIQVICELDEDKLIQLYERKELKYYTWRIITNMIQSSTSKFYRQYRQQFVAVSEIEANSDSFDEYEYETTLRQVEANIEAANAKQGNEWYYVNMLLAYLRHGTYDATAKAIGIPKVSVYVAVQTAKKLIYDSLDKPSLGFSAG